MGWDVLPTRNAEAVMLLGSIVRRTVVREIAKGGLGSVFGRRKM